MVIRNDGKKHGAKVRYARSLHDAPERARQGLGSARPLRLAWHRGFGGELSLDHGALVVERCEGGVRD